MWNKITSLSHYVSARTDEAAWASQRDPLQPASHYHQSDDRTPFIASNQRPLLLQLLLLLLYAALGRPFTT